MPALEGVCSKGMSAPGGVCSGGVSAPGGAGWLPGPGGVPGGDPPMATAVGGMHPTGMYSCLKCGQFGQ